MTRATPGWPVALAAASGGVLLSAALLALAINITLSIGSGSAPLAATGSRLVTIMPGGAPTTLGRAGPSRPGALTIADVDAIARVVPQASVISRVVSGSPPTVVVDSDPGARVQGVDPSYAQLWSGSVSGGDFFSVQDAVAANRVAVLGQTVAANLFPNGQSPIGQTIRIREEPFTVVGVLASHASPSPESPDDSVLVPFQTAQVRLFGTRSVYDLVLRLPNASQADLATGQIQQVLRQRHKVGPGQADDFIVRTDAGAPATSTSAPATQTLLALLHDVQQYGCIAKDLCRTTQPPVG
ncbi:MAG: ABC transporter permease [Chloroflexi bacterium]|nr:ABC transporter permease [Chloroflexota bacterium]